MKKHLLVCTLFFAALVQMPAQCLMYPVLLSQRIPQSDLVVEGKVIDQICFWNAEHNRIYTSNLVDVYKTFKNSGASYIEVITEGGTVGDKKHVLNPALNIQIGDVGVFTLVSNNQPAQFGKPVFEAYASAQGFIQYNLAENKAVEPFNTYNNISTDLYPAIQQLTGANYVQVKTVNPFQQAVATGNTTQAVAAITSFTPTTITAGTKSVLTITGTAFGATANASMVGFKSADNGGSGNISPLATDIVSWTNTQIQVRVPSGAGTGKISVNGLSSTGNLTIPYAHINVVNGGDSYMTKHINRGAGGYVWTYNPGFLTNAPAKAAFERSMNSWRCNTYVNWTLASGTSNISVGAKDNINIVTFDATLPSGVLGRCTNYFDGCFNGSSQDWYVDELDIVFDPTPGTGTTWQYGPASPSGSQYDFESVTAHELGHGHELGHVINNADLMHFNIGTATTKRTINADDLAGGLAVMSRNAQSGGTCGEPLMIPLMPSACALGSFGAGISSSADGCLNQAIALSDASSGSPTSWSWSMPGGTPASANTQNTSVTYATAGAKVVSLTVTSGTASSTTSQTITVNTPPTLSVTPTATTICTGQQVVLKASGATGYVWTPGSGGAVNPVTPANTTTYTVVGTANTCTSAPVTIVVTVVICTGLEDLESHNELSVYPNPSTGIFTISSSNNTGKLDVTVLNMLGQAVKAESSKDSKSVELDMSTFSKGVYYVKVQMNDGTKLVKVILD